MFFWPADLHHLHQERQDPWQFHDFDAWVVILFTNVIPSCTTIVEQIDTATIPAGKRAEVGRSLPHWR